MEKSEYEKVKVVNARSSSVDDLSRMAECAVDGDTSTRWASSFDGSREWLELELEQAYELSKIRLSWETAFAKKYRILTSMDGINWQCDMEINYGNGYTESKKLNGQKAKYIRIECVERGTFFAYSLYEVEVFGKKIQQEETCEAENVVGEMFMPQSITPDSAKVLIDNSGMSGLEAPNHMHASFDENDETSKNMINNNMYLGDKSAIIIDLGKKECLGEMYFWNYNDIRNLENGMKHITIDYSEDGVEYSRAGVYLLGKSSLSDNNRYGGNVACSVDGGHSVDFKGVTGRYVRITPIDNYGGTRYGLSEVRIFRHKTEPLSGDSLTIDAFAPNQLRNVTVNNAFNNSGLNIIDGTTLSGENHSNKKEDMCILEGDSNQSMIIMNLDGNYPLNTIKLWNYNFGDDLEIGIKDFEIWYTVGAPCNIITHSNKEIHNGALDNIDFSQGDWKKLGEYSLQKGTGKENLTAQIEIDAKGIRAQHIKIIPKTNHKGTNDIFGLSEVKVYVEKGWATEYSREWTGILSSSGSFAYQGNTKADNKGSSLCDDNNGRGWIGGDGFHTTSLNGEQLVGSVNKNSKTIFTFQDSFEGNFGNYDGFGYDQGYATVDGCGFSIGMRNHAYMMLEGDEPDVRNIKSYMQLENGISDSDGYGGNIYPGKYWLGDSTVINHNLYTIANRFVGLEVPDADFYKSPLGSNGFPSMTAIPEKIAGDIGATTEAVYHESIYEEGEYLYLYGKKDNKLVVSRVLADDYENLTGFTYWNGFEWVKNAEDAVAISSFMPGNEFNVTKIQEGTFAGKYMLIHTSFSITGAVCYALSDSPMGPFVEPTDHQVYWSTEKYKLHMRYYPDKPVIFQQWNYNAKSQPAISKAGELLITYHFGIHDDQENRVPAYGFFNAVGKEYEHPTFIKMFDVEERNVEQSENNHTKIQINGWQLSTTAEGYRVVYSVSDAEQQVEKVGLVYGLEDYVEKRDMVVGSTNKTVYSYEATDKGKTDVVFGDMKNAQSYVMTMKFVKNADFYREGISVRAFAKLKDGSYVYSDVHSYSVYNIANYLYQNNKMNTIDNHNYLYNNILSVVNPDYKTVDFKWENYIIKSYGL